MRRQEDLALSETRIPFFGIGAKHTGAAWLSTLLRSYPDCAIAPTGELHFFQLRYGQCDAREYYLSRSARLQYLARIVAKNMLGGLRSLDDGTSIEDDNAYDDDETDDAIDLDTVDAVNTLAWTDEVRESFFRGADVDGALAEIADVVAQLSICDSESYARYLEHRVPGAKAFGEIAPAYAFLPATAFAEIDARFPAARFIFIMQDPVEQLFSQVRFAAEKAKSRGRQFNPSREFRRALSRPETMERSNYQTTILNLESVIPARRILYLFHEKVTSPHTGRDELRRIESALGLARNETGDELFTSATHELEIERADVALARKMFSPVYRFVEDRFGEIPGWNSAVKSGRSKSERAS